MPEPRRDTHGGALPEREPHRAADRHGGKIREAAERLGVAPEELLDFSANVSFLAPTAAMREAAAGALARAGWYPEERPEELRRLAADFLSVPPERVLLGNGASELIFLVVAALAPRRVLVLRPAFTEYERAAEAWGAAIDSVQMPEERDFRPTWNDLEEQGFPAKLRNADLLFLCEPNNPTGTLLERDVRDRILVEAAKAGTAVLVDESFLAFTQAWPQGSALRAPGRAARRAEDESVGSRLFVLHSLTKLLAIPGLRVGALTVPEGQIEAMSRRLPPWNINCVAAAAAVAGLSDSPLIKQTAAAVREVREPLREALGRLPGIDAVLPGEANFLCVHLKRPVAQDLTEATLEQGVLIRDLTDFPGLDGRYFRVAVRSAEENQRLLRALRSALGALGERTEEQENFGSLPRPVAEVGQ